jgi:hypothetical protein
MNTDLRDRLEIDTWIDAELEKPLRYERYGDCWRSNTVLIADAKEQKMYIGYWESWEDNQYTPQWKTEGRDGYQISGVTHWRPLPVMPKTVVFKPFA